MPWKNVHYFRNGAMDGMVWAHSAPGIPWDLQNCYIDSGQIKTRPGHTSVEDDAAIADKEILSHYYRPAIHYGVVDDGTGTFGRWATGTFEALGKYTTGTAAVSGTTVTLTMPASDTNDTRTWLRGSNAIYFRANNGGWTSWIRISAVSKSTANTFTVSTAPGDGTGLSYEIAFGCGTNRGRTELVNDRYFVTVCGQTPVVYDKIVNKSWIAGIPKPEAPSASLSGASTPDAGWYGYYASFESILGVSSTALSPVLARQATVDNDTIDISVTNPGIMAGTIFIWRTIHQASAALAGSASKYLLTVIPVNGFKTVTFTDTAYDDNVDTDVEFSSGTGSMFNCNAPAGEFYETDENSGYYGIAVAYQLYSGEIGPASERTVVRKTSDTQDIDITIPAGLYYAKRFIVYSTKAQTSLKDAKKAQLYYATDININTTSWSIPGEDDFLNLTWKASIEANPWSEAGNFKGVIYSAGRLYVYGGWKWIYASGAVYYDIENGTATGLDEVNYWNLQFDVIDGVIYSMEEFQNNLYAFTANDTYVLDRTNARADLWYFAKAASGFGCAVDNMTAPGTVGIYSIQKGARGGYEMRVLTASGAQRTLPGLQSTIDSVTTFYKMFCCNSRVFLSTDVGMIVYNEYDGTWSVDTGVTVTAMSEQNGVIYAGDSAGDVYSLYTKAQGTAGDEGAYTYYVRSGAFNSGAPPHPTQFLNMWLRATNDGSPAHAATVKFSLDAYSSYVSKEPSGDYSLAVEVPASSEDYVYHGAAGPKASGELCGIEICGTGGYGKIALSGYGLRDNGPKLEVIGD